MSYATLLVHLQVGQPNDAVLEAARSLAQTHNATVLGVAVAHRTQNLHEEDYVFFAGIIEKNLPAYHARIAATEAEFHAAFQGVANAEWHFGETYHSVAEYLAAEARGADLVIVSADLPARQPTPNATFDLAELVVHAGRPVLGVPKLLARPSSFARGMVYWKDTVETRHAVAGALPLLQKASYVSLVQTASETELAGEQKRMELVVQWFKRHGVTVESSALDSNGDDAGRLREFGREQDPDFVVAGAYSHSRLRERVFGGVTRDILRNIDRYLLLTH